jgi:SAM-dependent methyltransferase
MGRLDWAIGGLIAGLVLGVVSALAVVLTEGRFGGAGLMRRLYDRVGPALFGARSEADTWRALLAALDLRGGERLLDVGTAIGDLPRTLAAQPNGPRLALGIDWSPRMLATAAEVARSRGLTERTGFVVADARSPLPFPNGVFDVVICFGVLETVRRPEPVLAELVRVLAPDGTLVLSRYRGWATRTGALSLEWYRARLAPAGLDDLRVVPCRHRQDAVLARARVRVAPPAEAAPQAKVAPPAPTAAPVE